VSAAQDAANADDGQRLRADRPGSPNDAVDRGLCGDRFVT
jgi:hypothetical protein